MRLCIDGWIDTYLQYTEGQESPTAFHKWTALTILGAAVGRNVWIPRLKYVIHPNLYVILVAASAKCRKSTALATGKYILEHIKNPPMIFAQKITVEALIKSLQDSYDKTNNSCGGLILSSELSVFMGSDAMKSGTIPALTDLYDSPKRWTYHTRGRGKEILDNVSLSMLAATTKATIQQCLPKGSIGGGFTSRIVFVYQDTPSKIKLFADDTDDREALTVAEKNLRQKLIHDLHYIRNCFQGPVKFTEEAREVSTEWYEQEHSTVRDEKMDGYFGRKHDTMFKIATLLSMSKDNTLLIQAHHVEKALKLLEENEGTMHMILESAMASEAGNVIDRVFTIIKKYRKIEHADLIKKSWRFATSMEMSSVITTLLEGGEIEQEIEGAKRYYKKGKGK